VPNPLSKNITPLTKNTWAILRRHTVLAAVLAILCLGFAGFSLYIGFIQMVILLIPVAVFVTLMLHRRTKKGADHGRAETIAALSYIAIGAVLTFGLIQAVPYGRNHNAYVASRSGEMKWDSPRTRELTVNACYGCHSDQIEYPSYASIAPISWAVQSHIDEGRDKLNFSRFTDTSRRFDDVIEVIQDGSMPPSYYTRFGKHPEANLSNAEIAELVAGLKASLALNGVSAQSEREHGDDND
jgi:hypothetical protein